MTTGNTLPFLEEWITESATRLSVLAGRPLTETEMDRLRTTAIEKCKDRPVAIHNTHRNVRINTTLGNIATWLKTRKPHMPIITGHGTLFKPHEEYRSIVGELVTFLMKTRKVAKNRMFELMRSGRSVDDPEVKALNLRQLIFKLLANSFYGAYGEKGFIFYNENMGPATTYTGQLIISATMTSFESFLAGNFWLRDQNEMLRHVYSCLKQADKRDPRDEWGEYYSDDLSTRETAIKCLVNGSAPGWDAEGYAAKLVANLSDIDLWSIVLRGNPYAFMGFEKVNTLLCTAFGGEIKEADPEKIEKHHPEGKAALDEIARGLIDWVGVHWMHHDMPRIVAEMERKAVLLVDTDSNFLSLDPWMNWLHTNFDMDEATEEEELTGMNMMVYFLRLLSDYQMATLTKNLNVPVDKRGLINFKSEFVISRIVLTNGKKNYAALLRFQEGARIVGDKVELKGLAMKKTTIAKSTGLFFEESLETNILRDPAISRINVIRDIVSLEDRIREALDQGSLEYSTPGVLGRISGYADMYAMPVVRGMTAWNTIEINSPIREGERINMFRSKIGTDATAMVAIMESFQENTFERKAIEDLISVFFDPASDAGLLKNGLNWIAVPKEVSVIPLWCRPLIDIESVIQANVAPILPILESLGIQQLPSSDIYSNIVKF